MRLRPHLRPLRDHRDRRRGGAGRVRDFVSTGVTEDEHRRMAEWVDGPRLVAHLRDLPPAVRTADVGWCVSAGIATGPYCRRVSP